MGATDLLGKPINKDDLIARLNDMLQTKSSPDEIFTQNMRILPEGRRTDCGFGGFPIGLYMAAYKVAEYRDYKTENHIVRGGCHSRVIAEELGMGREFIETLFPGQSSP